jgi:hypothetical protein
MVLFGAGCVLLALLTFRDDSPVRLGGRALGLMLFGGTIIFGLGLLACVSGVFTSFTGKESGIGPPMGEQFVDE